jgi:hypothetical protein
MTGEMRYVADPAVDKDGLIGVGSESVRSFKTIEAVERGLKEVPLAVVYDKSENRHTLYSHGTAVREVPWDWGKWPPHLPVEPR